MIFLVGLQGMGKTTTSVKLAYYIQNKLNKKPGLVSVDVYRPAAREQLNHLAESHGLPIYKGEGLNKPRKILKGALKWVKGRKYRSSSCGYSGSSSN